MPPGERTRGPKRTARKKPPSLPQDLLLSIIESLPARIFWKDRESRYLGCNTLFAKDAGFDQPDELIGKTDFEMGWRTEADSYRQQDLAVMTSGKAELGFEEPQTTPEGGVRWLNTSKVPLRGPDNTIQGIIGIYEDMTRRKQVDAALKESEARNRSIIETAMDGFWLTDMEGRVLEVNDAYCRMSGYSAAEILQKSVEEFEAPGASEASLAHVRRAVEDGSARFEVRHRRKDGSLFDLEVSIQHRPQQGGQFVAFLRDITEHKRSEVALRMSEERHRSILNASPDNITITDLSGRIVLVSPVGVATMGYAKEAEVVGRSLYDFIAEEERPRAAENIARMFQGVLTGPEEYRGLRADGSAIDLEVNGEFIRGSEGEPRELVFIVRDVTERKRARAELSASEERHRTILQQSHDMITKLTLQVPGVVYQYRLFPDGRSSFPFASPGIWSIYEVTPEEVRHDATPAFGRLHPDDSEQVTALIHESARTLDPFHCEFRVVLPGQGLRWRLCDARPERMDDGGTLWHGIISDITERKEAEDLLRLSLKEKEGLLREVHHRVKNNLQVISSLLRLETSRSAAHDTKRVLGDMQGRILSMAVLHETLYRSGRFGQVDLGGYLRQLAQQLFRAAASTTRLRLELEPVFLEIDQAIPCGLIVNELLTNSLKHAFAEGTAGEVAMSLALNPRGEVQITVADTGVGLPTDFDTKRVRSLGLVLVTDLVRQIGGSLSIGPGPGAAFGVTFTPVMTHLPGAPESPGGPISPSPGRAREGP